MVALFVAAHYLQGVHDAYVNRMDRMIALLESIKEDALALRIWTAARQDERDEAFEEHTEAFNQWMADEDKKDTE